MLCLVGFLLPRCQQAATLSAWGSKAGAAFFGEVPWVGSTGLLTSTVRSHPWCKGCTRAQHLALGETEEVGLVEGLGAS